MSSIFYKWFFIAAFTITASAFSYHPIYVSVVDIEYNAKAKTLEVSCKIFTDDLEKVLRSNYKVPVDLVNPSNRAGMDKLVDDYVQKHFKVNTDNRPVKLNYIGFEQEEEGINCYFESQNITTPRNITVTNNLLYEYKPEQIGLLHITVNGNRKSTKLVNPSDKASLDF